MSRTRTLLHPSELPLPQVGMQHLAEPRLWTVDQVRVIDGARSYLNIKFATTLGWRPLTLDLHVPLDSVGPSPVPVVVYAHGGSMVGGVKEMGPWASLPGSGIAVASVDYRLAGEVRYPEAIEDVLAAIRWVRSHADEYGLDSERIAGWGSSAGGYLMARAAFADDEPVGRPVGLDTDTSAQLSALVLHYAPTDFASVLKDAFEPTDAGQNLTEEVISQFFGFPISEQPDVVAGASLLEAVSHARYRPPIHISHGDADHRVGLAQSKRLHDFVVSVGGQSTLEVVPGGEHAAVEFNSVPIVDNAVQFLRSTWSGST